VHCGGGLIVRGETENEKYGNNLNELLAPDGLRLENDTGQDYAHHHGSAPSRVLGAVEDGARGRGGDLLARVGKVCFYRATTLAACSDAVVAVRAASTSTRPGAPLLAAARHGDGRVIVARRPVPAARLHAGARPAATRPRSRGWHRAPGRDAEVQAERVPRHLLRGVDRAGAVAGLDRGARAGPLGIDRSKLAHWIAGHDLVAARVAPAAGSRRAAGAREFDEAEDPRGYLDLIPPDEYPLSIFYSSLKTKLAP
jgi:hypothetical protein